MNANIYYDNKSIHSRLVNLPVQVNPSPVYPGRQVHWKLPTLLVQLASGLQPPLLVTHSLISASSHVLNHTIIYYL